MTNPVPLGWEQDTTRAAALMPDHAVEPESSNADLKEMRRQIELAREQENAILGGGSLPHGDDPQGEAGAKQNNARSALGGGDDDGVEQAFVAQCLSENERGDGRLLASLCRSKLVFVKLFQRWLWWDGNHWTIDVMDLAHDAVELVAQKYEGEAVRVQEEHEAAERAGAGQEDLKGYLRQIKKIRSRVDKLRSVCGARNCLEFAHKIGESSLAIRGDELDQKPMILPCKNCVVDLTTGKVAPSRPEDFLLHAAPVEWLGIDEPCPTWERFISEILDGNVELIQFLQTLLGYAITGLTSEHFIACFLGEGRNGKGTLFETLRALLGDLAWNVSPELLLEQKNSRSSAGPSPDLISLKGRRLVLASETDERSKVSGSKIKLLTGADTINARAPHDKEEINFRPSHKLFLYTNHLPYGLARDYALYNRLLFIQFPLSFIDNPKCEYERKRDPDLPAKLAKEYSGILAWLVRGALKWRAGGGLHPPASIRNEVDKLRLAEDSFLQFYTDRLERTDPFLKIRFADVYTAYKAWYLDEIAENDRHLPSKKGVSKWLVSNRFEVVRKGGNTYVHGLQFKDISG